MTGSLTTGRFWSLRGLFLSQASPQNLQSCAASEERRAASLGSKAFPLLPFQAPTRSTGFPGRFVTVCGGKAGAETRLPPRGEDRAAAAGGRPPPPALTRGGACAGPTTAAASVEGWGGTSGPAAGVAASGESPLPNREIPAAAPAGTPRYGDSATRSQRRPPAPRRTLAPPPQRPPSVAVSPFLPLRSSPLLQPGLPPSPQQPPAPPHSPPGFGPLPFSPAPQPPGAFSPFQPSPGFPDQPYPRGRLPPAPLAAGGCGKRCPPPRRGSPLSRGGARPGPARGVEKLRRRREGGRASGRALRALKGGRPSSSPGGEGGRAKQEQQRQQQQQQQQAPPAAPGSSAGLYAPGSITARPGEEREGAAAWPRFTFPGHVLGKRG